MNLEKELVQWDRKSAEDIQKILEKYKDEKLLIHNILNLATSPLHEVGATWLLKRYLEVGGIIKSFEAHRVYQLIPNLTSWEARLHLLQSISYIPVQQGDRKIVEAFVRRGVSDPNRFIRAWSYNGLYELARSFPELKSEVKTFFDMAMKDEAASVKARIRNLLKKGL